MDRRLGRDVGFAGSCARFGRYWWEWIVSIMRNRGLLASVGVATATVTTFAGFAPAVVSTAGAVDGTDGANATAAEPTANGTYESCSAYFGYGKNEESGDSAFDLTTFPVTVEGGTPAGEAPTVENGSIDVLLVLTDIDGEELRCVPEEVTEEEWDATWGDIPIDELKIPAWPGPGHYAYPTILPTELAPTRVGVLVQRPAAIGGLNDLESVAFEVVGVPEGYTLVDPTQAQVLPQAFFDTIRQFADLQSADPVVPPVINEVIDAAAGPAAVTAYAEAFDFCINQPDQNAEPPNANDLDLVAAVQALLDYVVKPGAVPPAEAPVNCSDLSVTLGVGFFVFAINATIATESPITVSLPVEPTTTAPPAPPAARPAQVTPAFTG